MLFLDRENFYKVTRAIYHANNGVLKVNNCYHFRWDVKEQTAEEMIIEDEEGVCYCPCCNRIQPKETMENIQKLVAYLNEGGRDEKKMSEYFEDVDIFQWAVTEPGEIVYNYTSGGFLVSDLENSFGYNELPTCVEEDEEEEYPDII